MSLLEKRNGANQAVSFERMEDDVLAIEKEAKELQDRFGNKENCGVGGNTLLDSNNLLLLECAMRQIAIVTNKITGEPIEQLVPSEIVSEALFRRVHQLMKKIKHDIQKCFMIANGKHSAIASYSFKEDQETSSSPFKVGWSC